MNDSERIKQELLGLTLTPYEEKYPDLLENLSPVEFEAVRMYFSGNYRTLSEIALKLPISASTISKILARQEVKEYWKILRQMFYQDMAMATMKGSRAVHDILDDAEASHKDKLAATKFAAEVTGVNTADEGEKGKKGAYALGEVVRAVMRESIEIGRQEEQVKVLGPPVNGKKMEITYESEDYDYSG